MNSGPPTVLIVEDERELADLYTVWLEDEYRVRTAYDGEQALERLDAGVDVVLLDRRMPGMSGDEVLGRIREREGNYHVAMVTAIDPDYDVLKLDVDEYVTKPLSRENLQEIVEELSTRGTFEEEFQRAMALAAKKEAIEKVKSPAELQNNTAYDVLTAELAEYRDQVDDQLTELTEPDSHVYFPYSTGRIALNSIIISMIAVALVVIHFGLPDIRRQLLTSAGSPGTNPAVSYLLTFVHFNSSHLVGNVIGYLGAAFLTYGLCMRIRAERWFYITVPLLLTALPFGTIVISNELFGLLYPEIDPVFLGFSTVVAGFVGFAFLATLFVVRAIYDHRTVFFIGMFILLVLVDSLLWINDNQMSLVVGIATVLVLVIIVITGFREISGNSRDLKRFAERLGVLLGITTLFGVFGLGLFPVLALTDSTRMTDPTTTNVFGHFLGVFIGFVLAFSTAFLADLFPIRERMRREGYAPPDRLL